MFRRVLLMGCVAALLGVSGCSSDEVEIVSEEEAANQSPDEVAAREQLHQMMMQREAYQAQEAEQIEQNRRSSE